MQDEVSKNRDLICNMKLLMVTYHRSGPSMQHEVTYGQDLVCNMKLLMVGTLSATAS